MKKKKIHPFQFAVMSIFAETNEEAKVRLESFEPYTKEEIFQQEQNKLRKQLSRIKFKGE